MVRFEAHRYSSLKKFAHIRAFEGERLVAIVRQPKKTIPMVDGLQGEKHDYWRVDCDHKDFEPTVNESLKDAIKTYLDTDKVSVFASP